MSRRPLLLASLLVAACSSSAPVDGGVDFAVDDAGATVDGGAALDGALTACAMSGAPRAVVVASAGASAELDVYSQVGGQLVDHGLRFTSIPNPDLVAMRPDGAEAAIAYGGFGSPYGVLTVAIAPDGTKATLGTPLELGADLTPEGLDYVTSDRLLLAASAQQHFLVTLERRGGAFVEVARAPSAGSFPLQIARRPGTDEALLPRADVGSDPSTAVYLVGPTDGGVYAPVGAPAEVTPDSLLVALHPSGARAYSPTGNANDQVTPTHLDVTGSLFVLDVAASGVSLHASPTVPHAMDTVAVDPAGRFLVGNGVLYEIDPSTGTPIVERFVLLTLPLDGSGLPGAALPESPPFPALLFNDLKVTASGHLLVSLEMYPDKVPPDMAHPLELRAQTAPGRWEVCQTIQLPGAARVAVAP